MVNCVELGEWPYGDVVDGSVKVIKKLLVWAYNNSPEGQRYQLSDNEFGIKFLDLFPMMINGIVQKYDNGLVKSIVQTGPNIKFTDKSGCQQYGYIIPPLQQCRDAINISLEGKNIWEEKDGWRASKSNVSDDIYQLLKDYTRPF